MFNAVPTFCQKGSTKKRSWVKQQAPLSFLNVVMHYCICLAKRDKKIPVFHIKKVWAKGLS
jgi:hypothetical protein